MDLWSKPSLVLRLLPLDSDGFDQKSMATMLWLYIPPDWLVLRHEFQGGPSYALNVATTALAS